MLLHRNSILSLVPVIAASFLQACIKNPEPPQNAAPEKKPVAQTIDQRKEKFSQARDYAAYLNKTVGLQLADLKKQSIDGHGQVFFKNGVGIVYPKPLEIQRSVVNHYTDCIAHHFNPQGVRDAAYGCETEKIYSAASEAKILPPETVPLYINGPHKLVCDNRAAAWFTTTSVYNPSYHKLCKEFSATSLGSHSLYQKLEPLVRQASGQISPETVKWAKSMPAPPLPTDPPPFPALRN